MTCIVCFWHLFQVLALCTNLHFLNYILALGTKLVKYIFRLGKNTRTGDIVQIIDANVWTSYILLSCTTTVVLLLIGALVY